MSTEKKLKCGLVMPISTMGSYSSSHWLDVKSIIIEAVESIEKYDFEVKLVSEADGVSVIQKSIVQNLYNSDVVICDVSGTNPNVMFELGMRLAFDKPTIIIKDDLTNYSFDTGVIEHIEYPTDLRFGEIVKLKEIIVEKVLATYEEAIEDPEASVFLGNFGQFKVVELDQEATSAEKLSYEMLQDMQIEMSKISSQMNNLSGSNNSKAFNQLKYSDRNQQKAKPSDFTRFGKEIIKTRAEFIEKNNMKDVSESYQEFEGNQQFYDLLLEKYKKQIHQMFEKNQAFEEFVDSYATIPF